MKFIFPIVILFFSFESLAQSIFDRRLSNGQYVFDALIEKGISREPLDLIFRMFDYNAGVIANTNYAVLVDYGKPSTEKRLFLLNLNNANVESYYVAHGINSGVVQTRSFSNRPDSWKSSLGFYYANGSYRSEKNGLSLYLDGIDRSNDQARFRSIVLHGAKYVSEEFIRTNGRLGWSEGCFAVGLEHISYLVEILQPGSLLLSYHSDLFRSSKSYPTDQGLPGQEVVPPGVRRERTPGEGGGFNSLTLPGLKYLR